MIDVRNATLAADGIDVSLEHVDDRRSTLRSHDGRKVEAIDVQRLGRRSDR